MVIDLTLKTLVAILSLMQRTNIIATGIIFL